MEACMVSARIAAVLVATASVCYPQLPTPPVDQTPYKAGFVNDTKLEEPAVAAPKPAARPNLTPEMRGDILMARKMYREAVEIYAQGDPNSAVLVNKVGIAFHQLTELELAKKSYERSIKLNPKYAEAVNNLGTVYYAKKSYRKAVNTYRKALALNPNSASIYSNLGTAQFARKKYKEASEAYQQALALDPEVFEHRSSHGVLLQERSVQERAKFHYFMAKTYAKAGAIERALVYMRKALEEGFMERQKFREDPEFAALQELPEFQQLITLEPRVL
jgi:tetratricopeptide (TPR) repeat protein